MWIGHPLLALSGAAILPIRLCAESRFTPYTDDDGETGVYFINEKEPCNPNITTFSRQLDVERMKVANGTGKAHYLKTERTRCYVPAKAKHSDMSQRFLEDVPVDYGVALPLPAHWPENWKSLSRAEFMEKYGNEVLKQYDLPADEDMERAEQEDESEIAGDLMIYD
ncbi:hypothetical protein B0H10DRAFT_1960997 [Mycena sp. CBHHK59/15]|nr:hypothetical protein B0H10DRAFT_1960997 [Mycena sp. CBHHK59/15]